MNTGRLNATLLILAFLWVFPAATLSAQDNRQGGLKNFFKKKNASDAVIHPTANFPLESGFNIVSSFEDKDALQLAQKIDNFLKKKGVAKSTFSTTQAKRNIIVAKVTDIPTVPQGTPDAYSIEVTKNKITIRFTSPLSSVWAYNALVSFYGSREGLVSKISKKNKHFFKGEYVVGITGDDGESDVIDLVKKTGADLAGAKSVIDRCRQNDVLSAYLVFVSCDGWKIKSSVMELVNPYENICAAGGFDYAALREIARYAGDNGVEIIPVFDFVSEENECFQAFTGHPVHSVEGLRFTRAFLEEFCKNTAFETISLGKKTDNEELRRKYITPLVEVLNKYERKAVLY